MKLITFLVIAISRDRSNKCIKLSQTRYLTKTLEKFGMSDCKPVSTPQDPSIKLEPNTGECVNKQKFQSAIGSLNYAVLATRPDLAAALNSVNSYMQNPGYTHWQAVNRIFRYIKGTLNYGLVFDASKITDLLLYGFADANFDADNDCKSTSGYIYFLAGCPVSWSSKRQSMVALSTAEAEYIAASMATQEALWLRNLLTDLELELTGPTTIYEDNAGAIALTKNPEHHACTKHFDRKVHFVRDRVNSNEVELQYCPTRDMIADALTKATVRDTFTRLRNLMGVDEIT